MSKAEFIEAVAKNGKISKSEAKSAVELVFETIETGLKEARKDGRFLIGTFGTFVTSKRGAAWAAIRAPARRSRSRPRRACASGRRRN